MAQPDAPLAPEDLLPFIKDLDCRGTLYIAFSGGLDSTALLLAMAQLRPGLPAPLQAIHVNHGVHPSAGHWAEHCQRLCDTLEIPLTLVPPPDTPLPKDSPEAQWRHWRLRAFETVLDDEDVVCTAHHRQDQAESLMLALLRSSGPQGLAAMPDVRPLRQGRMGRPLLLYPRASLREFVEQQGTDFIEDPGNRDTSLDRNFLRHELMPVLEQRWPAAERALAHSAGLFARLSAQLDDEGSLALAGREPYPGVLDLGRLTDDPHALALVIRHWLRRRGAAPLPGARMQDLVRQLCSAAPDRNIHFEWKHQRLDHAQNRLWLSSGVLQPCSAHSRWDDGIIELGESSGSLAIQPAALATGLRVAPRQGGETYRSAPGAPKKTLKNWFNDLRLPSWYRACVPLVFQEQRLLAVGDAIVDEELANTLAQQLGMLRWTPKDSMLAWAWRECRQARLQVK